MSQIIFMCGTVGSGKTTFATKLAAEKKAIRFSPDEWMIPLFGEQMERELFDNRLKTLTDRFKEVALQCIAIGVPVIFDYGLWKKSERNQMRDWAESLGVSWEIVWIDTPKEECERRALHRNDPDNASHFVMNQEMLDLFWSWFETPDASEEITRMRYSPQSL